MSFSALFVRRPIGTTLLTLGIALAGILAFFHLPVSPLPQVDLPTIFVGANMPGASAEVMATSVATPLERHLGLIADVTEMTSSSSLGSTRIILQFGLDRDVDGAARDVQAAINAARADLPASLRSNPFYRKANPSDAPVVVLALTSATMTPGQIYDAATTVVAQKLSQIEGIGQVDIGGASLPAVRVELLPDALFKYGIGLEDVRAALAAANAHSPKGAIEEGERRFQIYTNDQATTADDYRSLVIAYRNGASVRLSDLAEVTDSVEDLRNKGLANGRPSVVVELYRQPSANIIELADRVKAALPQLRVSIPPAIDIAVMADRTTTIRASLRDTETTLVIAIALVILVVFVFLRNARATLIPSIAVPVSLAGTFAGMYLLGYSLNNFSLMAIIISTGFVVDDAIVVLENVSRHVEAGIPRRQAAIQGTREVTFTVLSMSLSLIAVFIPILAMGGIVGRLFREFAVTLSLAILVSMVVSLTITPMLCAHIARRRREEEQGRLFRAGERVFQVILGFYGHTLNWVLRHNLLVFLVFLVTVGITIHLYRVIPMGFFPQQDTGRLLGMIQADQSISFQAMQEKLQELVTIVRNDPTVDAVTGSTGGNQTNTGRIFVALKPLAERKDSADKVIARLRRATRDVAGARLFFQSMQDIRSGGRPSASQFQYTLQSDDIAALRYWMPRITEALQRAPELADVASDQQDSGLESNLVIDRDTASKLGLGMNQIDNTLYDAFGQRQVSTIYAPLNQYHVVMEVAPRYWQSPDTLKQIYVSTSGGTPSGSQSSNAPAGTVDANAGAASVASDTARNLNLNALANSGRGATSSGAAVSTRAETMVPLAAIARYETGNAPLSVNHQGLFVASTISFNLREGVALGEAAAAIQQTMVRIGVPSSVRGGFQGTAKMFQESLANEPILILAALLAVYAVLGILYESWIHPLTILSTLPSAGLGALLALMATGMEFSLIALIGVILLIGIVKKNAIMMIDFAIDVQRRTGLHPKEAIHHAALIRFRPIMMTTMAALFGALPLALGSGDGAELRQPLGIAIIGGLIVSQILTLYTTPIIYLELDRLRLLGWRRKKLSIAE